VYILFYINIRAILECTIPTFKVFLYDASVCGVYRHSGLLPFCCSVYSVSIRYGLPSIADCDGKKDAELVEMYFCSYGHTLKRS
jgi:hypothetical protein